MPVSAREKTLLVVTSLALASCGGGGGGGNGGSGPAPIQVVGGATSVAPPPPPTSPPPFDPVAANLRPPAPFGLTADTNLVLVGWQETSRGEDPPLLALADQKASLSWSDSLKTYSVHLPDLSSGRLVQTFPGNPLAFSIVQADGSLAKVYVTVRLQEVSGDLFWQTADGIRPFVYGRAIFGIPFSGNLPSVGRRTFTSKGDPEGAIVFDFAMMKVSGTVSSFHDGGGWYPFGPMEKASIEPASIQADGSFTAIISVPGAPRKGELRGRLLGPAGTELAVYWNAPVRNGWDGAFEDWRAVERYTECSTCSV